MAQAPCYLEIVSREEFSLQVVRGTPHSLSPDGSWFLSVGEQHGLCLYSTHELTFKDCYKMEVEGPHWISKKSIRWTPHGEGLAFSTMDNRLWLLVPEEGMRQLSTSVGKPYSITWSPNGEYLAVGGSGIIVVSPPGALAEAPVAHYEGILSGLHWGGENTLIYGLNKPYQEKFQLWSVTADGSESPKLLWSYPYPDLYLVDLSSQGNFALVGAGLVNLKRVSIYRSGKINLPLGSTFPLMATGGFTPTGKSTEQKKKLDPIMF